MSELSSGIVPKFISKIAEKVLPNFSVKAVNIFKYDQLFGNVSFMVFDNSPALNEDVLFTFLNEASTITGKLINKLDLEESNKRFELASAATQDVIWDWDLQSNEVTWGNSVFQIFGDIDLIGDITDWDKHLHPDDKERVWKNMEKDMQNQTKSTYVDEYRFKRGDGSYCRVKDSATIIRDKKGKAIRMIGAMRDMTETLDYIKKIETQNTRLKTISWIQSHEVRAPLSRILGIAELLKEKDLETDLSQELIENIIKSSKELDTVINSIVDQTKN